MSPFTAELIGTAILVIFGNGVVANVVLSRTKGNNSGWIVITAGWAIGVFVGVFCAQPFSGAHINPAVTFAMAAAGKLPWISVPIYVSAQMLGAFIGAATVMMFYREHFKATEDRAAKLACFSTAPNIRKFPQAFFCEAVGTFLLVLPVFLLTEPSFTFPGSSDPATPIGLGALGALPVALLVFGIGLSLGGTTGYAINPARDLGPRLAHALLPVPGKGSSDWSYSWVPILGPLTGALLAVLVNAALS
jgi:glycerol uptake facilitator protein